MHNLRINIHNSETSTFSQHNIDTYA